MTQKKLLSSFLYFQLSVEAVKTEIEMYKCNETKNVQLGK